VRHIALGEGNLWGRREVAIPVSAVASLDDGIRLNITNKQVEELPPRSWRSPSRMRSGQLGQRCTLHWPGQK
jgi:hypothetical protein